jgi:Rad51
MDYTYTVIVPQHIRRLKDVRTEGEEFTTGDPRLDKALGGGIRTGMIWEVAGERCVRRSSIENKYLTNNYQVLRVRPSWHCNSLYSFSSH